MKAYIKSYEEIKKNSIVDGRYIYAGNDKNKVGTAFVPGMKKFCEKGPFDFEMIKCFGKKQWYKGANWHWHKSWLKPAVENEQYLLEF